MYTKYRSSIVKWGWVVWVLPLLSLLFIVSSPADTAQAKSISIQFDYATEVPDKYHAGIWAAIEADGHLLYADENTYVVTAFGAYNGDWMYATLAPQKLIDLGWDYLSEWPTLHLIAHYDGQQWVGHFEQSRSYTDLALKAPTEWIDFSYLEESDNTTRANTDIKFPWASPNSWRMTRLRHNLDNEALDFTPDTSSMRILAAADGVVQTPICDDGYQVWLRINHPNSTVTRYAHLADTNPPGNLIGNRVLQGQYIGNLYNGTAKTAYPGSCGSVPALQFSTPCGCATGANVEFNLPSQSTPVCGVTNWSVGTSYQSCNVEVSGGSPTAPNNVANNNNTATSARVTWNDRSDNEERFRVQRQINGGSWANLTTVSPNTQSITTGIACGNNYRYRVRGENYVGNSIFVAASNAIIARPCVPNNVTNSGNATDTSVTITWNDNSNNEVRFLIQRQVNGGGWTNVKTVGANTQSTTAGISCGNSYRYRVRAENSTANSAFGTASSTVLTKPCVPNNVTNSGNATDTSVTITWNDNSNNEVRFRIQRQVNGGAWASIKTVGANSESTTAGISCGNNYRYRIRAENAQGNSAFGTASNTVVTTPCVPSNVSSSGNSADTSTTITWTDTSNNEGSFRLQHQVNGGAWANVKTVGSNSESTTAGISCGNNYRHRVRAENGSGSSNFSAASSTIVTKPCAAALNVTLDSNGEANLVWLNGSYNLENYRIERRINDGVWRSTGTFATSVTSANDNTLSCGTKADYRVYSINSSGERSSAIGTVNTAPCPVQMGTEKIESGARVLWADESYNETGFYVQRRSQAAPIWATIYTAAPNTQVYSDTDVQCGTPYQYRVIAYNETGQAISNYSIEEIATFCQLLENTSFETLPSISTDWKIDPSTLTPGDVWYELPPSLSTSGDAYALVFNVGAHAQAGIIQTVEVTASKGEKYRVSMDVGSYNLQGNGVAAVQIILRDANGSSIGSKRCLFPVSGSSAFSTYSCTITIPDNRVSEILVAVGHANYTGGTIAFDDVELRRAQ